MAIFFLLDEQWGRAMNASGVRMLAFTRGIGRLLVVGVTLGCLPEKSQAAEDNVFAGIAAEYHYRTKYKNMKGHKAFAIGPNGSYGYSWGWKTAKEAAKGALKSCREDVAWWKKTVGAFTGDCRLLAQDNKLLVSNPWIGPEWQKPMAGEDIPLLKGRNIKHAGSPVKGIVLHVHGCDGLGWDKYSEVWGAYFDALGFSFFAPNSLAEARPAAICGWATPARAKDQTILLKLRVAQTQRTIAGLKKEYPGLPIFVWGHSEGSVVVKFLEADVAGIVLSGSNCSADGLKIAAPASVSVLFMLGDNDPYAGGFKFPITAKAAQKCRNFTRNKNTKIVVVKNNKHQYWPWRPEIAKAISEFIGAKSYSLAQLRPVEKLTLTARQTAGRALYQKNAGHKAFAVGPNGTFSAATQWDFDEDAIQFALYNCAHVDNRNVFRMPTHVCSVINVGDKDVAAP
jgi:hypothetical protein